MSRLSLWRRVIIVSGSLTAVALAWAALSATRHALSDEPPIPMPPRVTPVVGPAGQSGPFNAGVPSLPTNPGRPTSHGEFRLIPYGFADSLAHRALTVPPGTFAKIEDMSTAKASPQYREPTYVPPGYSLKQAEAWGFDGKAQSVTLRYEGPSFPIVVHRRLLWELPVDVQLPPADGETTVRTGKIRDAHAVFEDARPGTRFQVPLVVRFIEGQELTVIQWRSRGATDAASQFAEVLKIAESMSR